jgi:hypothetical protein
MEASIFLRFATPDAELADAISDNLDADGPVFEEDVIPKYRSVFRALENFFPPEFLTRVDATTLELCWTAGSDFEAFLEDAVRALDKCGVQAMVGYFWADEEEGFFVYKNRKIQSTKGWWKKLKALDIQIPDDDDDEQDEWISVFLGHLQNEYFVGETP